MALWNSLSVPVQDMLWLSALLLPAALIPLLLWRGFRPWPLVRALLWRFRWANTAYILLIAVSVGMGIGILAQDRALREGSARAADKFDLVVTAPGSEISMMMATVYLQIANAPLVDGASYDRIASHPAVALAAPLAYGDSYQGAPIVGTTAEFVRHLSEDRIEGRLWEAPLEAVVGANIPLPLGAGFQPAHGLGGNADAQAHAGAEIIVVGRMARTGSPWDSAILIPVEEVWETHGLANGHAPGDGPPQLGPPFDPDYFPGTPAVVVRAKVQYQLYALRSEFMRDGETMAFFPGSVLNRLHRIMGDVRAAMSLLSLVSQALVAASVLLGLFILSRLFQRQLALLRALGAPPRFVVAVIWSYGAVLVLIGALLGLLSGLATASILSEIISTRTGLAITARLSWSELHTVAAFVGSTLLLTLVPALAVLRGNILTALRA